MSRCDKPIMYMNWRGDVIGEPLAFTSIKNAIAYTEARRRCRMWNRLFLLSLMVTMVVALWATFNHI